MAAIDDTATQWFSRQIVTLEMTYTVRHRTRQEEARCYYTGFLLYEQGATIWVTAGHCMEEIENAILANPADYDNVSFRFVDTLHSAAISDQPVPFDYRAASFKSHLFHRNDAGTELGFDFGVIFLPSHYSRLLAANNIAPVDAANWTNVPDSFDAYFMLGLPGERVQQLENGVYTVRPAMFSISKLDEKPACFVEQTDPMFYAEIDPNSDVANIKGMSGGPILGMKFNREANTVRYWVIGVQSKRIGRIISASPLFTLHHMLMSVIPTMFGQTETEHEQVSD
jgi:hypothetical protein